MLFCSTGLPGEEERVGFNHFEANKSSENWDVQIMNPCSRVSPNTIMDVIKQEVCQSGNMYGEDQFHHHHHHHHASSSGLIGSSNWSHMVPVSSPISTSHVTSLSSSSDNMLDFTYNKVDHRNNNPLPTDQISEVNYLIIYKFLLINYYFFKNFQLLYILILYNL